METFIVVREIHQIIALKNANGKIHYKDKNVLNIGCFGAIRPLKNQLYQAVAAIEFANSINKKLHFHVNIARVENNGDPVLKNLRNLFINNPKHKLVEHSWLTHEDFINLVRKMDIGLQVSFTETFSPKAALSSSMALAWSTNVVIKVPSGATQTLVLHSYC